MNLLVYFVIITTITLCGGQQYGNCVSKDYREIKCLKESVGYALFTCKQGEDGKLIWKKDGTITKCTAPLDGCRCWSNNYWNYDDTGCECFNPTKAPHFPSFGAIYWKGETYEKGYGDFGYGTWETNTILNGEAHKLKNGAYLKKEWKHVDGKEQKTMEFELIVQNNDGKTYKKYTGNDQSRSCSQKEESVEGSLSSLWRRVDDYTISSSKETKTGIYVQTWKKNNDGESDYDRKKWIVKYDSEKDHGVPLTYDYYYYDDIDGRKETKKLEFNYEPTEKNDIETRPSFYCDNV